MRNSIGSSKGSPIKWTPTGMVFSRDQLLDRVWGDDRSVTPRSVDVYVRRVREKIEPQPQTPTYIQTVHMKPVCKTKVLRLQSGSN